jgi:predicted HicB family RNase H-like nuclease
VDILKYKDYEGTAELDMDRQVCRGKILFINDLVTYETDTPANLQKEFEAAVDDYIETCASLGREPQKPLKGQFNVRIPPTMHKDAVLRAVADNVKLNDVVVRAMAAFLYANPNVNHNVRVTVNIPQESMDTLISTASGKLQWTKPLEATSYVQ